ncbi:MAG: DUF4190 domain-containing protein [Crocinitomicaceae bacterium]|nr:DUF4190 domain-containing protein [Flavobacteriales bacterium]NQZ36871.1 DUF4190 domain-containing protein [Crocinitomicaceae bacterium]
MTDGTQKKNGMATAAMVLGIISIVLGLFGWLGIITGIVAVILAIVAKKQIKADPSMAGSAGAAKGGLIMGIIGIALGIIITILAIMALNALASGLQDSFDQYEIETSY